MTEDLLEIRAQLLALRQFTVGFYASILVARPGPVTACQSLAQTSIAGYEKACESGAIPDPSPELIQQSIAQLQQLWHDVEQSLRQRGYTA